MADRQTYALACIELYSQLWAELEQLCVLRAHSSSRCQIVRLEIHLALQSCEGWRWRTLLSSPQRRAVQETLAQALSYLDADGYQIGLYAAQSAQDRLLDAVLDHCADLEHGARSIGAS